MVRDNYELFPLNTDVKKFLNKINGLRVFKSRV